MTNQLHDQPATGLKILATLKILSDMLCRKVSYTIWIWSIYLLNTWITSLTLSAIIVLKKDKWHRESQDTDFMRAAVPPACYLKTTNMWDIANLTHVFELPKVIRGLSLQVCDRNELWKRLRITEANTIELDIERDGNSASPLHWCMCYSQRLEIHSIASVMLAPQTFMWHCCLWCERNRHTSVRVFL